MSYRLIVCDFFAVRFRDDEAPPRRRAKLLGVQGDRLARKIDLRKLIVRGPDIDKVFAQTKISDNCGNGAQSFSERLVEMNNLNSPRTDDSAQR